ncbi:MAG: lytic transglycosylase domain-containing protein [Phenylobacterium sp.]|uniref:lytic transglycosylase domain-containing protein n=1 Tax=Phenylobacterium sp. TaxID=1871053 RepID=UPI002734A559|nr:lytic transglycosylase domain-containing protein [Phenylobacterium sp.]MDP3747820.1 lytic transglycosylase domain-containing protein [Phenylobacterium sp.]
MVRPALIALLAATCASAAQAQPADWSRAGGSLFVRAVADSPPGPTFPDPSLPRLQPPGQPFAQAVADAADRHGLDPKLLHALIIVESGYQAHAVSPQGAGGLTQLMPGTAADLGVVDRFDPLENLDGGANYLARQVLRFGDLKLALAAYNAGPARVARLGAVPPIAETQAYVAAVIDCFLALSAGRGVRAARQCRTAEGRP